MKKCNECGQAYPDEVEVCTNCNTPLAEETYVVSGAEPRAERPEARKSAPGHKATGKMALFFLISLVYFTVTTGAWVTGENFVQYMWPFLLGGLPMGICLALCLKNANPGVGKLGVGSCLCGLAASLSPIVAVLVLVTIRCDPSVEEWTEFFVSLPGILKETLGTLDGDTLLPFLFLAAWHAILCFLIAWLTGRILRKKSNK